MTAVESSAEKDQLPEGSGILSEQNVEDPDDSEDQDDASGQEDSGDPEYGSPFRDSGDMSDWEEKECRVCHTIFHPVMEQQTCCFPCLVGFGRHSRVQKRMQYTGAEALPVQKKIRRQNDTARKRREAAGQYFMFVEHPMEAFAECRQVLEEAREWYEKSGAPEDMQKRLAALQKTLGQDIREAVSLILDSSEVYESSVEQFTAAFPSRPAPGTAVPDDSIDSILEDAMEGLAHEPDT